MSPEPDHISNPDVLAIDKITEQERRKIAVDFARVTQEIVDLTQRALENLPKSMLIAGFAFETGRENGCIHPIIRGTNKWTTYLAGGTDFNNCQLLERLPDKGFSKLYKINWGDAAQIYKDFSCWIAANVYGQWSESTVKSQQNVGTDGMLLIVDQAMSCDQVIGAFFNSSPTYMNLATREWLRAGLERAAGRVNSGNNPSSE